MYDCLCRTSLGTRLTIFPKLYKECVDLLDGLGQLGSLEQPPEFRANFEFFAFFFGVYLLEQLVPAILYQEILKIRPEISAGQLHGSPMKRLLSRSGKGLIERVFGGHLQFALNPGAPGSNHNVLVGQTYPPGVLGVSCYSIS